ncbi:BCCT family transporter [Afifella marina]|uniref:Betaine/carnitine transporter, BCCT family n=1 Tax=Afifella marina DSM 2698 TaxID=1120955 RepID=A0A1G5PBU5_AFIMA|nr:BCCT family transporter [Afifella marina]MBK1625475.1 BCCT family transporter [Afifella marina DSM 2698]MBK1629094.1 BCCT family transporter [Afifella marina]MBK5917373.1 BCCT transporter [Afifella marina]RAI17457.1 BCCT transporter [Afifella marina DSM 2698]SCZ46521.1 betaine/carnitine transporter, BCCT family [Afifella marina DSM 2698]
MSEQTADQTGDATEDIPTDYEVGQDNIQVFGLDFHNPVFIVSGLTIILFVALSLIFQQGAESFFTWLRPFLTSNLDWLFLIAGNAFVLFSLFLIVSPFGKIRLGGPDARPEYNYAGWFAMLFAAGMGIGLMFYGVSEPLTHYNASVAADAGQAGSDAPLMGAPGDPEAARRLAMAATIFHWGLHPWAIYAVVALALALFSYNKGLPLTIRSAFYPIFGEAVWGWLGHVIDTLAVFATLFGLATSLGFGAEQALAGLNHIFGIPDTDPWKVGLIVAITGCALTSVVAGLDAGVKRLSEINMILAFLLLVFVVAVGPTLAIVSGFFENIVAYARDIIPLSNPIGRNDDSFRNGWTTFYWAWWISWSPFVGMFIARVSYGRTVREFMICVLIIPTIVSIFWMTAFGGTAISQLMNGYEGAVSAELPVKLFLMLEHLPLASITSFIGIVLVIVFFVTSSDSGSLVIDTITAGGKVDAPVAQRVFWATFEGLVAIALLLGGGLKALQSAAVATGFPFALILLLMIWCIYQGLKGEQRALVEAQEAEATA